MKQPLSYVHPEAIVAENEVAINVAETVVKTAKAKRAAKK